MGTQNPRRRKQRRTVRPSNPTPAAADRKRGLSWSAVAKDTEKLIRQLSLISYLMAERRPVTATEIRRDVEGYSDMTEDAFARRFYADRAELDSLGIHLTVDRPADGFSEQENYSLAPEAFFLPSIAFSDAELAALQTALSLLDGEFAYAEPLRLALQQLTWGRPSPLGSPAQRAIGLGITGSPAAPSSPPASPRSTRRSTAASGSSSSTSRSSRARPPSRKVDPYELLFEGGQFYLVGWSHERGAIRVFRLSRMRGKVAYATKAEHDFQRPDGFDPRDYANRIPWQLGDPVGTAEIHVSDRIAWHVERNFGRYGTLAHADDGGQVFRTDYAIAAAPARLGAGLRAERPAARAAGAGRGAGPPARARRRAAPRRAVHLGRRRPPAARPGGGARGAARASARPPASARSASRGSSRSPPC